MAVFVGLAFVIAGAAQSGTGIFVLNRKLLSAEKGYLKSKVWSGAQ
jgi:hypothetical protein